MKSSIFGMLKISTLNEQEICTEMKMINMFGIHTQLIGFISQKRGWEQRYFFFCAAATDCSYQTGVEASELFTIK